MTKPDRSPIDPAAYSMLEDVADGDTEFMFDLITQYLQDAVLLVDEFALALAKQDGEALERAAHTLKSASANVGAMTLSNLCDQLQQVGRSAELAAAETAVPAAEAEFTRVRDELELRLTKLSGQG